MSRWTYQELVKTLESYAGSNHLDGAKDRKRARILQAASDLFVESGYRKTSVDKVARRAGIAKGTVYLYFKSKVDLLFHAIAVEKQLYMHRIAPIFRPEVPAREKLRLWLREALVLATQMPLTSRLLGGDHELLIALQEMDPALAKDLDAMRMDFLGEIIAEATAPRAWTRPELEDRVRVLVGFMYFAGLLGDENVRGGLPVERFAEILADMVVDGIASKKGGELGAKDETEVSG